MRHDSSADRRSPVILLAQICIPMFCIFHDSKAISHDEGKSSVCMYVTALFLPLDHLRAANRLEEAASWCDGLEQSFHKWWRLLAARIARRPSRKRLRLPDRRPLRRAAPRPHCARQQAPNSPEGAGATSRPATHCTERNGLHYVQLNFLATQGGHSKSWCWYSHRYVADGYRNGNC